MQCQPYQQIVLESRTSVGRIVGLLEQNITVKDVSFNQVGVPIFQDSTFAITR
jgi:hypothetical protein